MGDGVPICSTMREILSKDYLGLSSDSSIDLNTFAWKLFFRKGLSVLPENYDAETFSKREPPVANLLVSMINQKPEELLASEAAENVDPEILRTLIFGREDGLARTYYNRFAERISKFDLLTMSAFVDDQYSWRFNTDGRFDSPAYPLYGFFNNRYIVVLGVKFR